MRKMYTKKELIDLIENNSCYAYKVEFTDGVNFLYFSSNPDITNFADLKADLVARGHTASTNAYESVSSMEKSSGELQIKEMYGIYESSGYIKATFHRITFAIEDGALTMTKSSQTSSYSNLVLNKLW